MKRRGIQVRSHCVPQKFPVESYHRRMPPDRRDRKRRINPFCGCLSRLLQRANVLIVFVIPELELDDKSFLE